MHQYIYVPKARKGLGKKDIENILAVSKKNNKKKNITGVLVYSEGVFIQVLEGKRSRLDKLITNIEKDQRSKDLVIISSHPVSYPMFKDWSMGYLDGVSDELIRPMINNSIVSLKSIEKNLKAEDQWVTSFLEEAIRSLADA